MVHEVFHSDRWRLLLAEAQHSVQLFYRSVSWAASGKFGRKFWKQKNIFVYTSSPQSVDFNDFTIPYIFIQYGTHHLNNECKEKTAF